MTKRQRAQVVELLRCAADLENTGRCQAPIAEACHWFGYEPFAFPFGPAVDARADVQWSLPVQRHDDKVAILLEAAQRVEDGDWP